MISQGGFIDDFLSHLMCCCCALVQELREVEIRGAYGINYIPIILTIFDFKSCSTNNDRLLVPLQVRRRRK